MKSASYIKPLIVITGKNGQLGWELEQLHATLENEFNFLFTDRIILDLADESSIENFFQQYQPNYFINCAAYTAVDKAESESGIAFQVNALTVGLLAKHCAAIDCTFITISTDYVFDGEKKSPYLPSDTTHPINQYGLSKQQGEDLALKENPSSIIIRTSWVYSSHGNNFVKTMLRLMKEREEIKVVADQLGCPTYAKDLAIAILKIIEEIKTGNRHSGIYHYSNSGIISWHQFAEAIKTFTGMNCSVLPIPSSSYPTPAKRSHYSAMDTQKIVNDFQIKIKDWQLSLQQCLQQMGY
jgi:dTDP-4-dehydrorhamnose reductase